MKLFQKPRIQFHTYEMLESMVELSKEKAIMYNDMNHGVDIDQMSYFDLITTQFSFGRRAGHTTAAIEYIKRHPRSILVVHNQETCNRLRLQHNLPNDKVLCVTGNRFYERHPGISSNFTAKTIIFDVCDYKSSRVFLSKISKNYYLIDKVNSVVLVEPTI